MLGVIAIEVDQECSDSIFPYTKVWPTFRAALRALIEENQQLHYDSAEEGEPWPGTGWKLDPQEMDLDSTGHAEGVELFIETSPSSYFLLIAVEAV